MLWHLCQGGDALDYHMYLKSHLGWVRCVIAAIFERQHRQYESWEVNGKIFTRLLYTGK